MNGWKFYHRYDIASDAFAVFMRYTDTNGKISLVTPLQMEMITPGQPYNGLPTLGPKPGEWGDGGSPTYDVNGFLQAALDTAWEIGLRPKGFADNASEISAVRYHLEDMRLLAKVRKP